MACWNKSDCFNFLKLFRHKEKEVSEVSADWSFECWWKLFEKCQNRWWNLGVRLRCWKKSSLFALDGKIVATTKRSTSDRTNVKLTLLVFFYWKGIVHYEFVPCGETVNKEFYLNALKHLREAVGRKRPEAWTNNTWMMHHDNAPAHVSLLIHEFLLKHETTVPQLPYSPDLAPADFFFPKLKSSVKGCRFQTVEEREENLIRDLRTIPQNTYQDAFQNWKKTLGVVYQEWRGVLWRRQVWLRCK